jgi:hypothetical protein
MMVDECSRRVWISGVKCGESEAVIGPDATRLGLGQISQRSKCRLSDELMFKSNGIVAELVSD